MCRFLGLGALVLLMGVGCGGSKPPGKYGPRPEGCEITLFHDAPTVPTDNIGTVNAICGDDVKDADCMRTLKDEACKLGADVIWGVEDKPSMSYGKKKWDGRAAHTKAGGAK